MKHIADYQSEENLVEMRWVNNDKKINRPQDKIDMTDNYYEIDQKVQQPKAIRFEDEDFLEVSHSGMASKSYVNPFERGGLSLNAQMILEHDNDKKE